MQNAGLVSGVINGEFGENPSLIEPDGFMLPRGKGSRGVETFLFVQDVEAIGWGPRVRSHGQGHIGGGPHTEETSHGRPLEIRGIVTVNWSTGIRSVPIDRDSKARGVSANDFESRIADWTALEGNSDWGSGIINQHVGF